MKQKLLALTLLLNACAKDPTFHDLSSDQLTLVEHSIEYAHTESVYVGLLAESADQNTVFGNESTGTDAFKAVISQSLATLDNFLDNDKFVGFHSVEVEGKEDIGCFYYRNKRTGLEVIAFNLDYLDKGILPYSDCIVHEGVHANEDNSKDDHDEDLLDLIDSYGTSNYYTSETANLVVEKGDDSYLVSFFYFDADLVHGDPYEDTTSLESTLEEWADEKTKAWYDKHDFLSDPFKITEDEYRTALLTSRLYEDIQQKQGE